MALATRYPHCQTTFRVVQDQLKLRAGLVRCGACKEIFNGIEHLLSPTEPALTANTNAPKVSTPPTTTSSAAATTVQEQTKEQQPKIVSQESHIDDSVLEDNAHSASTSKSVEQNDAVTAENSSAPINENDPLQRMTLIHFADTVMGHHPNSNNVSQGTHQNSSAQTNNHHEEENHDEIARDDGPDPIDKAIEDLQRKPLRDDDHEQIEDANVIDSPELSDAEEPGFVTQGRRKQQFAHGLRIFMAIASVILFISLTLQSFYVFRTQIAMRIPSTQPLLSSMCKVFGCRLNLPTQIEFVTIESSELQALSNSTGFFLLTMLLRNHSSTTQAWPNIELTLNDSHEKLLSRRVFLPSEYLTTSQEVAQGFGSTSEQSVKLYFEPLLIKPAGYRVYLFYP